MCRFSVESNTSNGQVSEKEPARDEGLLRVPGRFVHDVQVRGVETQGGGRETVRHQVDPQQLHWNQSLGETQDGRQEDTGRRQENQSGQSHAREGREGACLPHQTTSPTLEEMRYLMNCFMLL